MKARVAEGLGEEPHDRPEAQQGHKTAREEPAWSHPSSPSSGLRARLDVCWEHLLLIHGSLSAQRARERRRFPQGLEEWAWRGPGLEVEPSIETSSAGGKDHF